jgi:hypothetical protein
MNWRLYAPDDVLSHSSIGFWRSFARLLGWASILIVS